MLGILSKLAALGMILLILAFAVLIVTKDKLLKGDRELDDEEVIEAVVERIERVDKKKAMENLRKMIDGQAVDKKIGIKEGQSSFTGEAKDLEKAVEASVDDEAVDLQKMLEENLETFEKDTSELADGETDLEQVVSWRIIGDWLYFRVAFSPWDSETHRLMQGGDDAIFMSFVDSSDERVVPASAAARIPTRNFYLQKKEELPFGWAFSGKLFVGKVNKKSINHSEVGWIFSQELATHLKRLKKARAAAEEGADQALSSR